MMGKHTDENTDTTYAYYLTYDETGRLNRNNANRIEFLLTMDVLASLFSRLDPMQAVAAEIGCGPGTYTVEIAPYVSRLYACDLMPNLLEVLKSRAKRKSLNQIIPINTNAEDLSAIPDKSCDITLCMGPLYHLKEEARRIRCLQECKRITKPGGMIVISYVNPRGLWKNVVKGSMTVAEYACFEAEEQVFSAPFVCRSPDAIEEELKGQGLHILQHIAADPFSSFIGSQINAMTDSDFASWLKIARRHREERSWLEFSVHGLIVAEAIQGECFSP